MSKRKGPTDRSVPVSESTGVSPLRSSLRKVRQRRRPCGLCNEAFTGKDEPRRITLAGLER